MARAEGRRARAAPQRDGDGGHEGGGECEVARQAAGDSERAARGGVVASVASHSGGFVGGVPAERPAVAAAGAGACACGHPTHHPTPHATVT